MRHYKRSNEYRASNVTFSVDDIEAYSYNWWCFVKIINGAVVFNNYTYSSTTTQHQSKVRQVMRQLGIEIDYSVACPKGLHRSDWKDNTLSHYNSMIDDIQTKIDAPRSHKKTNEARQHSIDIIKREIKELNIFCSPLKVALSGN